MDYSDAVSEMKEDISDPEEFGFKEYREEVRELGDPQYQIPVIHVAGTNGKGSTCNIIYDILREAGYSAGLFTGPHLEQLVERIEVDGEHIKRNELGDIYGEIRDENFSMFESLVIISFKHFINKETDIAIIETGCGGKRDATNIVDPEISVITNVGLDHSHVLGETLGEIAEEKAGIIKKGRPSITNAGEPALDVIETEAEEKNSKLTKPSRHVEKAGRRPLKLTYAGETFVSGLQADYQLENMNAAVEAVKRSDFEAPDEAIIRALKNINVPGRMEKISEEPEIFLDGAHNREGMEALTSSIESFETLVFGCMGKKPHEEMIELLRPYAENLIFTMPGKDHGWDPEEEDLPGEVIEDPVEAVEAAEGRTLVTGSLYLAGAVREEFKA